MQRSLERIEKYLDKLEAVTEYKDVKKQLETARSENKGLRAQLVKTRLEIKNYHTLKVKFEGREVSLKEVKDEQSKLIQLLYEEEIQGKAQEKFRSEAPQLTKIELERNLKLPPSERPQLLNDLLNQRVRETVNQTLQDESKWPQWFNQTVQNKISNSVNNSLSQIFWENVRKGVEDAKKKDWPEYVHKEISLRYKGLLENQLIQHLEIHPITWSCKKCHNRFEIDLDRIGITDLIVKGKIRLSCPIPNCVEGVFKEHPTITEISLGEVFLQVIGKPNMP